MPVVCAGGGLMEAPVIHVANVGHWFGDNKVLYDLDFTVNRGQIVGLVGPSGCGKSTLLRAIVGTHPPLAGSIRLVEPDGSEHPVSKPGRDRGIVYQRYSLFPNLTAAENAAMGLKLDQTSIPSRLFGFFAWRKQRKAHLEEAAAILEKVGLGHAINKYPHELSGGMRQRVSIAQALLMKPRILLLDEPFGALDEATREDLQRMLLTLYAENVEARAKGEPPPYTILIVTHELNEALFVSDRILGLSQYWDWKGAGLDAAPGATIVYDRAAPIFQPGDERETSGFRDQKREILHSTFDTENLQPRSDYIS